MSPQMKLDALLAGIIAFTMFVGYVLYVRPALKKNPSFAFLFTQEQSVIRAARAKVRGLKQRLLTGSLIAIGFVVEAYDWISPLVASSGVDVTQLSDKIPASWWPFIMMGVLALVQWFRELRERDLVAAEDPITVDAPSVLPTASLEVPMPSVAPPKPSPVAESQPVPPAVAAALAAPVPPPAPAKK